MKLKGLILAAAVVLATNAVLLALVARNRTGESDATIELTERELRLTPGDSDNTGVSLTMVWNSPYGFGLPPQARYPWFDRTKLESFGFDCRVPLTDSRAERHYGTQSMLTRPAFAVLEYGGEAWQKMLEREIEQAERLRQKRDAEGAETPEALESRADDAVARRSRLAVVDAGLDAAALRRRYPDRTRFIVTRALVTLVYVPKSSEPGSEEPRLTGTVVNILPEQIYVPRELRTPGDVLSTRPAPNEWPGTLLKHDPRYRVTIAYGSRLEPRVVKVQAGL